MANHNKQYNLKDKHAHLKYLLIKRCEIELEKHKYVNANLVAYNLFWLYPEDKKAKYELIQLYLKRAKQFMEDSNYDEVEKIIKSMLDVDSENAEAFLYLGIAHKLLGKKKQAETELSKARKLKPEVAKTTRIGSKETFLLKIANTDLVINKYIDLIKGKIKLIISGVKEGPGELILYRKDLAVSITRGTFAEDQYKKEELQDKAKLIIDDIYVNIFLEDDKLIVQSDFDVDIELKDMRGKKIQAKKIFGETTFLLKK